MDALGNKTYSQSRQTIMTEDITHLLRADRVVVDRTRVRFANLQWSVGGVGGVSLSVIYSGWGLSSG